MLAGAGKLSAVAEVLRPAMKVTEATETEIRRMRTVHPAVFAEIAATGVLDHPVRLSIPARRGLQALRAIKVLREAPNSKSSLTTLAAAGVDNSIPVISDSDMVRFVRESRISSRVKSPKAIEVFTLEAPQLPTELASVMATHQRNISGQHQAPSIRSQSSPLSL